MVWINVGGTIQETYLECDVGEDGTPVAARYYNPYEFKRTIKFSPPGEEPYEFVLEAAAYEVTELALPLDARPNVVAPPIQMF